MYAISSCPGPLLNKLIVYYILYRRALLAVQAQHSLQQVHKVCVTPYLVAIVRAQELWEITEQLLLCLYRLTDHILITLVIAPSQYWLINVLTNLHRLLLYHHWQLNLIRLTCNYVEQQYAKRKYVKGR